MSQLFPKIPNFCRLRRYIALRMVQWIFSRLGRGGGGSCANRWWNNFTIGKLEVKLLVTDTGQADRFSREELCQMIRQIRIQELEMNWKVPEPRQCCWRDNDFDGNCRVHAAPGVFRKHRVRRLPEGKQ